MKKAFNTLIYSTIIISILALAGCEKKDTISINNTKKEKKIAFSQENNNNLLDFNIYFNSSSKADTSEVGKEKRVIKRDELLAETIVNELIKGPSLQGKLTPVLPKDARLLSLSIKNSIAYVNLSEEANIIMTPEKEIACIKSIVLSLTQLSTINKVKIFVDNNDSNLFGNNFNLSKPIGKGDLKNIRSN